MFKWLKTKISNLYNRYKAWKKRHPMLTFCVSIGAMGTATAFTVTTLLVGTAEPVIVPLSVLFFAAFVLYANLYRFTYNRTGRFLDEAHALKMEVAA